MRTVLHVVNVGCHADVRIATKSALVHQKIVQNGRKSNAYWAERAFADNLGDLWNYYLDQINLTADIESATLRRHWDYCKRRVISALGLEVTLQIGGSG